MPLLLPVVPRLCLTAFTFAQPFLINKTLNYVDDQSPNSDYGKGLIGAWALVYLGLAVSVPPALDSLPIHSSLMLRRCRARYTGTNALGLL